MANLLDPSWYQGSNGTRPEPLPIHITSAVCYSDGMLKPLLSSADIDAPTGPPSWAGS